MRVQRQELRNEGHVKREVKKILTAHGWKYWMPAANAFGVQGQSDFLAIRNGVFLAIETKFGDNKPTVNQKKFLASIRRNGGVALEVNDRNLNVLARVMEILDQPDWEVELKRVGVIRP